ncbi:MAG: YicC family protein [Pelagimonas sp.]|jgi:uncharacterized protein (TIGR00255 family)|nr:YicC family protein [Pelagimonas sp.]
MRQSMTGFAAVQGTGAGFAWTWELRGVNGKGLDLRLRLPDWVEGLEAALRARLSDALARGNVQVSLRLSRDETEAAARLDPVQLDGLLRAMAGIEAAAMEAGVSLAPSTSAQILSQKGVLTQDAPEADQKALLAELLTDFDAALAAFCEMRASEGAAMASVLDGQLTRIAELTATAAGQLEARATAQSDRLRAQLARVMANTDGVDEARLAQELALIAVKSDVTEELDRLRAHVDAARDLLASDGPVGRKLDFLMQEFNREANTLCSKSQDAALTATGLELKTVIDQMREQVQNVE